MLCTGPGCGPGEALIITTRPPVIQEDRRLSDVDDDERSDDRSRLPMGSGSC